MNTNTRPRTATKIFPALIRPANPPPTVCPPPLSERTRLAAEALGCLREVAERHESALRKIALDDGGGMMAAALFLERLRRDLTAEYIARSAEALWLQP